MQNQNNCGIPFDIRLKLYTIFSVWLFLGQILIS